MGFVKLIMNDMRYVNCETGKQIEDRIAFLKLQENRDIDEARRCYENFWILKLMIEFNIPHDMAASEFFMNGTRMFIGK